MAASASAGGPPISGRSRQTILLLFSKPQHLDKLYLVFFSLPVSSRADDDQPRDLTSGWWVSLKVTGAGKASGNGQPFTEGLV